MFALALGNTETEITPDPDIQIDPSDPRKSITGVSVLAGDNEVFESVTVIVPSNAAFVNGIETSGNSSISIQNDVNVTVTEDLNTPFFTEEGVKNNGESDVSIEGDLILNTTVTMNSQDSGSVNITGIDANDDSTTTVTGITKIEATIIEPENGDIYVEAEGVAFDPGTEVNAGEVNVTLNTDGAPGTYADGISSQYSQTTDGTAEIKIENDINVQVKAEDGNASARGIYNENKDVLISVDGDVIVNTKGENDADRILARGIEEQLSGDGYTKADATITGNIEVATEGEAADADGIFINNHSNIDTAVWSEDIVAEATSGDGGANARGIYLYAVENGGVNANAANINVKATAAGSETDPEASAYGINASSRGSENLKEDSSDGESDEWIKTPVYTKAVVRADITSEAESTGGKSDATGIGANGIITEVVALGNVTVSADSEDASATGIWTYATNNGITTVTVDGDIKAATSDADLDKTSSQGIYAAASVNGAIDITVGNKDNLNENGIITQGGNIQTDGNGINIINSGSANTEIEVLGDVNADNYGLKIQSSGDSVADVIINGTLSGKESSVVISGSTTAENVQMTVWKIELTEADNEEEKHAVTKENKVYTYNEETKTYLPEPHQVVTEETKKIEENIRYIIKIEKNDNADLGVEGTEKVNEYATAKEGDKVILKVTPNEGYVVSEAYNGLGIKKPLLKDTDGNYYVIVEQGGGVYLSALLTSTNPQPVQPDPEPSQPVQPEPEKTDPEPSQPVQPETNKTDTAPSQTEQFAVKNVETIELNDPSLQNTFLTYQADNTSQNQTVPEIKNLKFNKEKNRYEFLRSDNCKLLELCEFHVTDALNLNGKGLYVEGKLVIDKGKSLRNTATVQCHELETKENSGLSVIDIVVRDMNNNYGKATINGSVNASGKLNSLKCKDLTIGKTAVVPAIGTLDCRGNLTVQNGKNYTIEIDKLAQNVVDLKIENYSSVHVKNSNASVTGKADIEGVFAVENNGILDFTNINLNGFSQISAEKINIKGNLTANTNLLRGDVSEFNPNIKYYGKSETYGYAHINAKNITVSGVLEYEKLTLPGNTNLKMTAENPIVKKSNSYSDFKGTLEVKNAEIKTIDPITYTNLDGFKNNVKITDKIKISNNAISEMKKAKENSTLDIIKNSSSKIDNNTAKKLADILDSKKDQSQKIQEISELKTDELTKNLVDGSGNVKITKEIFENSVIRNTVNLTKGGSNLTQQEKDAVYSLLASHNVVNISGNALVNFNIDYSKLKPNETIKYTDPNNSNITWYLKSGPELFNNTGYIDLVKQVGNTTTTTRITVTMNIEAARNNLSTIRTEGAKVANNLLNQAREETKSQLKSNLTSFIDYKTEININPYDAYDNLMKKYDFLDNNKIKNGFAVAVEGASIRKDIEDFFDTCHSAASTTEAITSYYINSGDDQKTKSVFDLDKIWENALAQVMGRKVN